MMHILTKNWRFDPAKAFMVRHKCGGMKQVRLVMLVGNKIRYGATRLLTIRRLNAKRMRQIAEEGTDAGGWRHPYCTM